MTIKTVSQLAVTFKLTSGTKAIKKAIADISVTGKKLDGMIQHAAMSIAAHIDEHCNSTLADDLYNAMPNGSRRNALADWFQKYAKLDVITKEMRDSDKEKFGERIFQFNKKKATKLEAGNSEPWWECKPEKPAEIAFDFNAQLKSLITRAKSAAESGKGFKVDEVGAAFLRQHGIAYKTEEQVKAEQDKVILRQAFAVRHPEFASLRDEVLASFAEDDKDSRDELWAEFDSVMDNEADMEVIVAAWRATVGSNEVATSAPITGTVEMSLMEKYAAVMMNIAVPLERKTEATAAMQDSEREESTVHALLDSILNPVEESEAVSEAA